MFDAKYKEACENMKLSESFKTGLVKMMKNEPVKAAPKTKLVLATVLAVVLVSTSAVFACNYMTQGQLFKTVMSGFNNEPQQTTNYSAAASTETDATAAELTAVPTADPTQTETVNPPTETSGVPAVTDVPTGSPTVPSATSAPSAGAAVTASPTPEATAAPTAKPTAVPTAKPTAVPSARTAPSVQAAAGTNSVTVTWGKITSPDLVGYKVVASKNCSTPKYSENGYYAWITDANTTSCTISNGDGYNGGDVGQFSGGTAYYFSVTAIYGSEWQKIAGNAVQVTMPGSAPAATTPAPSATCPAVSVSASAGSGGVNVSWSKTTDATGFSFYKIVASVNNSSPSYPDDGYVTYITDPNITSYFVSNTASYNGGDFGGAFSPGTTYYFSVTACYEGGKAPGNAVHVTMP